MEQAIRSGRGLSIFGLLNPVAMARNLWSYRELALQMAKRDIQGRYRAARLGLLWSVLNPLVLLAIYTFVFTEVFRVRWNDNSTESRGMFALTMFCGMLLFNLFSEVVTRAPQMVVANPNYVKKIVFPLEIFIVSGLLSGIFNMLIGYVVWFIGWGVVVREWPHVSVLWFPLVIVPVCLTSAGLSWLLASLGVFVRDVGQAVILAVQVLFFATPIFYPIERVPQRFRRVLELNPLTHAIEDVRQVLMHDGSPNWHWWLVSTGAAAVLAVLGYAFFMKSKRAFADVI
jgi:lipopolysaccharide transport system permease protein